MAEKLSYLQQKSLNPTGQLRQLLDELENRRPRIKHFTSTQALIFLRDLDSTLALFNEIEANGLDLFSERSRFNSLQNQVRKMNKALLRALGGATVLIEHRPTKPAPSTEEQWWWYIDATVAAQQQAQLKHVAIIGGIILSLFGGVLLLFRTILAPDPLVVALFDAEQDIFSEVEIGEYDKALQIADESLATIKPDDSALLLLKGVLHDQLNQPDEAEAAYEQAKAILPNLHNFHVARAQLFMRFSQYAKAEADAEAAIQSEENSAIGWFLLAQAMEYQGRIFEAQNAYEQAGSIALNTGVDEIAVMSRVALARISSGGFNLPVEGEPNE